MDVAVVGASGYVGQLLCVLVDRHPDMHLKQIIRVNPLKGVRFQDVYTISADSPYIASPDLLEMEFETLDQLKKCDLLFSAIKAENGYQIEEELKAYAPVLISTSPYHRDSLPADLVIPDVNMIARGLNFACVPNCVVAFVASALHPIHKWYGIKKVVITTLQALSGAGKGAMNSLIDDVIPYIESEEKKIKKELKTLLSSVAPFDASISCQVFRVPISHGHTASINIETLQPIDVAQLKQFYQERNDTFIYSDDVTFPRPSVVREKGNEMRVAVGNLKCEGLNLSMVASSHNLYKGAAGTAVQIAESYIKGKATNAKSYSGTEATIKP